MGHKRSRERMDAIAARLVDGMARHGIPREAAQRIHKQLTAFADYGFPESHAASFARLAWTSAWLKAHQPAAFLCALLNSQPMGFCPPAVLVSDAQRHGVPVDVLQSDWDSTLQWVEAPAAAGHAQRDAAGAAAGWDPAPATGAGAGSSGAPDGSHGGGGKSRSLASAGDAPGEQSDAAPPRYVAPPDDEALLADVGRLATGFPRAFHEAWTCTGSPPPVLRRPVLGVRLGLHLVRGLCEKHAGSVRTGLASVAERGPFVSPADFARRTGVPAQVLEHLAWLGALRGFEARRRHALWQVAALARRAPGPLAGPLPVEGDVTLPLCAAEAVRESYRMAGCRSSATRWSCCARACTRPACCPRANCCSAAPQRAAARCKSRAWPSAASVRPRPGASPS